MAAGAPDPSGHECNEVGGAAQSQICSFVGNFDVAFAADLGGVGNPISSVFSPDNTQPGFTNAAGQFVGWVGLDPSGLSETVFDAHKASFDGVLANIFTGTNQSGGNVPEPASMTLLGAGLGALAVLRRRRKTPKA